MALLNARQEVELAKRIEAGIYAAVTEPASRGNLDAAMKIPSPTQQVQALQQLIGAQPGTGDRDLQRARQRLADAEAKVCRFQAAIAAGIDRGAWSRASHGGG